MTIVAGFPGKGMQVSGENNPERAFVLLAADSEESGYVLKSSVRKIAAIEKTKWKCLIGGAGGGQFIDFAVQEIGQRLPDGLTLTELREGIEKIVTEIHQKRIRPLKESGHEFELLCALWVSGEGVQLVKVGRGCSLIECQPITIGYGEHLARYLIDTYYVWDRPLYHVMRLAVYLLSQVKKFVLSCGGASQIMWIDDAGLIGEMPLETVTEHERSNTAVMTVGPRGLLYLADPDGWGKNLSKVEGVIDDVGKMVKDNIRKHYPELVPPVQSDRVVKAIAALKTGNDGEVAPVAADK